MFEVILKIVMSHREEKIKMINGRIVTTIRVDLARVIDVTGCVW